MTLWTGGYALRCRVCGTPLLSDEERRGVCDDCRNDESLDHEALIMDEQDEEDRS